MTNHSEITEYNSLNDIRLKKEAIRKEIDADDAKIQTLWNTLFTKPEILSRNASPSKRLWMKQSVSPLEPNSFVV